jgi:pimeloyl-ACP methyl ester carboxylesterase
MKRILAGPLDVAYAEAGPPDGPAVILLHGFPYDAHAYDAVAEQLAAAGRRCIIPFLRGYGPTRFISAETPRSGQQAALGADLLALMDALAIPDAVLAGYDWGGRAACVVAALWPERVRGLVSGGAGYNIQNIAKAGLPVEAAQEHRFWYQYYFQTERGRAGLTADRRGLCRLLWQLWSPQWAFDDAAFEKTAAAFDNPDFVAVVIHSYRHRFGGIPGDPAYDSLEAQLAEQPRITVPTIVLHGDADGVDPASTSAAADPRFAGFYERQIVPGGIGHNIPQEAPAAFAEAVLAMP